jgi:transcriptional regulator with XRE-family HTH domain
MTETGVSQSELSRISGVRQPSISQFLSGRIEMSDELLDRLLSCLGYRLEVVRRPVRVELDRSHQRSWRLHRQLDTYLDADMLEDWSSTIKRNLERLRHTVQGEPHVSNLHRWVVLVEQRDVPGIRRVMTGLDTDSVQMREVSSLGGLLPQAERSKVLAVVGR